MRFAILGPVRAWLDDTELDTGSPAQRALLALLLVHAGQPVALTEIVDALWDDEPPRSAVNIVHRHVGTLRRLTDPDLPTRASGSLLLRSAGGYRLDVDPDTLDLLRFRQLHETARAASGAEAAKAYADALAVWQGPIAADVPDNVRKHAAFIAVEQEYLAALQEAAVISPARMLSALQRAATDHPLDENLQARLIEALAATGHETEAVETYEAVRARLADELGIDPGAELRAAHARIVNPQAASRNGRPTQLPADLASFAGRSAELDRAMRIDHAAMTTIAIFGMAGIGKTTLAVRLAHEAAPQFPDGQLYVNLRGFDPAGMVSSSAAVRGFLEALGVPPNRIPAQLDAQAALYRSLLAGKRMLVVVDNARDTEQVRPLLPGTPGCMVIITSRSQLRGLVARTGAQPLALDLPSMAEARDLIVRRLGAARVEAEPAAVTAIIDHCGRLPLALAIVAARAATYPDLPLASIAAELHGNLDALGDPENDVRTVFSWSYHALNPDAARLFRLLGVHPGPDISACAAASIAGLPIHQTLTLLDDLGHAHLINEQISGRFVFHDLLRAYAAELADGTETPPARVRLLDHYLHTANEATVLLYPFGTKIQLDRPHSGAVVEDLADHVHAAEWLRTELPVLQALQATAADNGLHRHAWQIPVTIDRFLARQARWQEQISLQHAAIASAVRTDDRVGVAYASQALGFAYGRLHDFADADTYMADALALFTDLGDHNGHAITHRLMAFLANMRTDHARALDHYAQAYALYQSSSNQGGLAALHNEIGWTHILLGDYEKALTECLLAIELNQLVGNTNGEASALDSVGYALHHLDRNTEALPYLDRALAIYRDIADENLEADTLSHIGDVRAALGESDAARTTWNEALAILDDLGHPEADDIRAKLLTIDSPASSINT